MRGVRVVKRKREEAVPDRGVDFRWAATVVTKGFKQGSGLGWHWPPWEEGEEGRAGVEVAGPARRRPRPKEVWQGVQQWRFPCLASCVSVATQMHGWELRLPGGSGFDQGL